MGFVSNSERFLNSFIGRTSPDLKCVTDQLVVVVANFGEFFQIRVIGKGQGTFVNQSGPELGRFAK